MLNNKSFHVSQKYWIKTIQGQRFDGVAFAEKGVRNISNAKESGRVCQREQGGGLL